MPHTIKIRKAINNPFKIVPLNMEGDLHDCMNDIMYKNLVSRFAKLYNDLLRIERIVAGELWRRRKL